MVEGNGAFNPYEPPRAEEGPADRGGSTVARPLWVQAGLWRTKLPGLTARRSAQVWLWFDAVCGVGFLVGAPWIDAILRPRWGFGVGMAAGLILLVAVVWIALAVGWVDRHQGW